MWGLASALRHQYLEMINVRELRVLLDVNRPREVRRDDPREVPLSSRIGDLCSGMAAHPREDMNQLIEVTDDGALSALGSGHYGLDADLKRISA